jgi:hypothetical protein
LVAQLLQLLVGDSRLTEHRIGLLPLPEHRVGGGDPVQWQTQERDRSAPGILEGVKHPARAVEGVLGGLLCSVLFCSPLTLLESLEATIPTVLRNDTLDSVPAAWGALAWGAHVSSILRGLADPEPHL